MDADTIKSWLDDSVSPMAFQRLVLRCLPELNKYNLFLHNINGQKLPDAVINTLDTALQEIYNKSFPQNFKTR